jgi:hypothetical protein
MKGKLKNRLVSIVLYGSSIYKKHPKDLDIIFIFKDKTPLKEVYKEVEKIYGKLFPIEKKRQNNFFSFLEEKFTIYKPPYLCHRKDFRNANFRKIFFSNRVPFWSFLFFRTGYLKNLQENSEILYGSNELKYWKRIGILKSEGIISFFQEIITICLCLVLYKLKKEKSEEYFRNVVKKLSLHLYITDKKNIPKKNDLIDYIKKEHPWLRKYTKKVKRRLDFLLMFKIFPLLLKSFTKICM